MDRRQRRRIYQTLGVEGRVAVLSSGEAIALQECKLTAGQREIEGDCENAVCADGRACWRGIVGPNLCNMLHSNVIAACVCR